VEIIANDFDSNDRHDLIGSFMAEYPFSSLDTPIDRTLASSGNNEARYVLCLELSSP